MGLSTSSPMTSYQGDIIRQCICNSSEELCIRHKCFLSSFHETTSQSSKKPRKHSHGFATFKKKLIGRCKNFKNPHSKDHSKYFREHLFEAPIEILRVLTAQYEVSSLMKDLSVQADLARPPAKTLSQNLGDLLDSGFCSDLTLICSGLRFHVHKSIIMARCPFFNKRIPLDSNSEISLGDTEINSEALSTLLRQLYTGEPLQSSIFRSNGSFETNFHVPNSLESDVSYLKDSTSLFDVDLIFGCSEEGFHHKISCHKAIISSRSPFFKNVLRRREEEKSSGLSSIVLDNDIIPAKYAFALHHAIYADELNLHLIPGDDSLISYAMDLYEIGRFLEFDLLSQNCEDFLLQSLNSNNLHQILEWSSKPHGSSWLKRQTYQYLSEEFTILSSNSCLSSLPINVLRNLIECEYTQASESEILEIVIRWGELQLLSKSESKECGNVNTLPRRHRRGICDKELRELISPLLSLIRIPHILTRDRSSEILDTALIRNLLQRPDNLLASTEEGTRYSVWDPRNINGLYVKPRFFIPYYESCKSLLKDRCSELTSISSHPHGLNVSLSDPLYRVEKYDVSEYSSPNSSPERTYKMVQRAHKLLHSLSVTRAMSSFYVNRWDVIHLVELRVVREFNLPDSYTSVLRKSLSISQSIDEDLNSEYSKMMATLHRVCPDVISRSFHNNTSSINLQRENSSPDIVEGISSF